MMITLGMQLLFAGKDLQPLVGIKSSPDVVKVLSTVLDGSGKIYSPLPKQNSADIVFGGAKDGMHLAGLLDLSSSETMIAAVLGGAANILLPGLLNLTQEEMQLVIGSIFIGSAIALGIASDNIKLFGTLGAVAGLLAGVSTLNPDLAVSITPIVLAGSGLGYLLADDEMSKKAAGVLGISFITTYALSNLLQKNKKSESAITF